MLELPKYNNPTVLVERVEEPDSFNLTYTTNKPMLRWLNGYVMSDTGLSLQELIEENPEKAYETVEFLFSKQFVDPEPWDSISAEKDHEFAYQGVQRYLESNRRPVLLVDDINVVISLWKWASPGDFIRGRWKVPEEVVRFSV